MQPTLLIVEDDQDLRNLFKFLFKKRPFAVLAVATAEQALTCLLENHVRAVLLDLTLPGMSGEEFIKHVRANPSHSEVKIIVMSGWDDLEKRARDIGADGYHTKPADLPKLEVQVDKLFETV